MSASQWKPDDVALLEFADDDPGVDERTMLALRDEPGGWQVVGGFVKDDHRGVTARPLVVIDPEDREQVERLARALDVKFASRGASFATTQAALRSLVADPKPEEPQGLGAVVEDADGRRWTRYRQTTTVRHWFPADSVGDGRRWIDFPAVRVLSEGVTV